MLLLFVAIVVVDAAADVQIVVVVAATQKSSPRVKRLCFGTTFSQEIKKELKPFVTNYNRQNL